LQPGNIPYNKKQMNVFLLNNNNNVLCRRNGNL
jgi:hypothetical protein